MEQARDFEGDVGSVSGGVVEPLTAKEKRMLGIMREKEEEYPEIGMIACVVMCVCVCREGERERERERERQRKNIRNIGMIACVVMYIYIHTHTHTHAYT
jgi:hypothetical protein